MKRLIVVVLLLLIVSSATLMAAGSQEQEAPKTLKVLTFTLLEKLLTEGLGGNILEDWTIESGVKIEFVFLPWNECTSRLYREASLSQTDIAVGQVHIRSIEPSMAKLLEPVDAHMSANPIEDFNDDFFKGMYDAAYFDNQHFIIPWRQAVTGFHYNELFYTERGIGGPPQTFEEFMDYARKCTYTRSDGTHVNGYFTDWAGPVSVDDIHFMRAFNADILTSDYAIKCNQPGMVKAITALKELYDEGVLPEGILALTDDDRYTWITQGRVAMTLNDFGSTVIYNDPEQSKLPGTWKTSPWPISETIESDYAVAPAAVTGWALGIPKNYAHKDLAWSFVRFISSRKSVLRLALNGNGPLRKSTYKNQEYMEKIPWAADELRVVSNGRPYFPGFDGGQRAYDVWSDDVKAAVVQGSMTPQEAMDHAAMEIEQLLVKAGISQ